VQVVWWIVFFLSSIPLMVKGGKAFWRFNMIIAVIITIIPIFYCLAVIPFLNFKANVPWPDPGEGDTPWFVGGVSKFMAVLPLAVWFYIGCENVPLACEETFEVRPFQCSFKGDVPKDDKVRK
jgi:amino acid transporter